MKSTLIRSILLAGLVFASMPLAAQAQHTRNPGGGGSGGGSSSGSGSSGSGGESTGSVAVPRGGGSSPWGGGGVSSRPSEPTTSSSSGGRSPARVSGSRGVGGGGSGSTGSMAVPSYSRPRNGAPVTGYAVPRGSVATLPPIISGPIYWGSDDWYFYPWGYGALALGYFWDPWMWTGYYGGMGGYPWMDPYWSGGGGGGGFGSWDHANGSSGEDASSEQNGNSQRAEANPLDSDGPTGALRLKVEPRNAEVLVDGFYAGLVDDFDGAMQKLKIVQGSHRIELRAAGYESVTFTVNVVAGETTSYTTELKRR